MSQAIRRALYRAKGLPDPGPTPSVEMTQLTVLVSKAMATKIDELHGFLVNQIPSRNDLLNELLLAGLREAAQSMAEAQAVKDAIGEAVEKKDIEVDKTDADRPALTIVPKEGLSPAEAAQISARLQALRSGGDIGAGGYGVRDSRPEPMVSE